MRLEKPFCGNTRKIMLLYLLSSLRKGIYLSTKKHEKLYAFREKTRIFLTIKKAHVALDPNHHSHERLCTKLRGSLFRKKGYIACPATLRYAGNYGRCIIWSVFYGAVVGVLEATREGASCSAHVLDLTVC